MSAWDISDEQYERQISALREDLAAKDREIARLQHGLRDAIETLEINPRLQLMTSERDEWKARAEQYQRERNIEAELRSIHERKRGELRTALEKAEADTRHDQSVIEVIEATVGDDFCEDLDMRAEELTGDLKLAHEKISAVYRIAHSARRDAACYAQHDDWRAETNAAIAAQERKG